MASIHRAHLPDTNIRDTLSDTDFFIRPEISRTFYHEGAGAAEHLLVPGLTHAQCLIAIAVGVVNLLLKSITTYFLHVLKKCRGASTGLILSLNLCYNELGNHIFLTSLLRYFSHLKRRMDRAGFVGPAHRRRGRQGSS